MRSEKRLSFQIYRSFKPIPLLPLLAACGSGGSSDDPDAQSRSGALPLDYRAPASAYITPSVGDSFGFSLATQLPDPYWVASLRSGEFSSLGAFINGFDRTFAYAFPDIVPQYYVGTDAELDWAAASPTMRSVFLEIFNSLETRFNIDFVETNDLAVANVIAISQKQLELGIAGYAYYPNLNDFIGADIFIDPEYNNPRFTGALTNFDYELMIHELGHALGLKHPFEVEGANNITLTASEDRSAWTVMTYTHDSSKFDGDFRGFDLMALAEAYGVRETYNAGNDVYTFSLTAPVFIIDGSGFDTVSAANLANAVTIDLREGAHSSIGAPSSYVSSASQLVISSGSLIECAIGGSGNDTITGNDLDNELRGGAGSDMIFGGEGADVITGGQGADLIDLSEVVGSRDTVVFDLRLELGGADTIYSFSQGASGDCILVEGEAVGALQAVVSSDRVPVAEVYGVILRVVGENLDNSAGVTEAFSSGGIFENLIIPSSSHVLALTADSQSTGASQCLFSIANVNGQLDVDALAVFQGNYLDIDSWVQSNFI